MSIFSHFGQEKQKNRHDFLPGRLFYYAINGSFHALWQHPSWITAVMLG
jgi:hypothetical protein